MELWLRAGQASVPALGGREGLYTLCWWEAEEQTGAGQQWDWDFILSFLWPMEQILPGAARTGHGMAVGEGGGGKDRVSGFNSAESVCDHTWTFFLLFRDA